MTTDLTGIFNGEEMKILTLQEAADKMGVSQRTIRRWITSGRLPAIRIGTSKVIRIDEDDLLQLTRRVDKRPRLSPPDASGQV